VEWLEDRCLLATGLSLLRASATGATLIVPAGQQFTAAVAHVRIADVRDVAAAIDWGDGQPSAGRLLAEGGVDFEVSGTHRYAHAGVFPLTVSLAGGGGSSLNVAGKVDVVNRSVGLFLLDDPSEGEGGTSPSAAGDGHGSATSSSERMGSSRSPSQAPPSKPTHFQGPGALAAVAVVNLTDTPSAPIPSPPPVDATTFAVWSSQRDRGSTVAQPAAFDGGPERSEDQLAPLVNNEGAASAVGPSPATSGALRELLRDDQVMVALADAARAPDPAPGTPPAPRAGATAAAAPPREKDNRARPPTAWQLLPALVYGLVWHWGWPKLHCRGERDS
jgi:hypothetical protein